MTNEKILKLQRDRKTPIETLLIATSLRPASDRVVRAGLELAKAFGAQAILVHGLPTEAAAVLPGEPWVRPSLLSQLLAAKETQLEEQAVRLGTEVGVTPRIAVGIGAPHRTLREQAIARGSTPSLLVRTVTEWAAGEGAPEMSADALQSVRVLDARGPARPGGLRFGELVHAILAAVPLAADRAVIDALADTQGRILAAAAEERAAAGDTVQRVLAHEVVARARRADERGACRRETPVTLTLPDGTLIEGIVDLAFEENGAWTVVDYKTDRELAAAGEDRYRRQVALYASAIAQATGRPTSGVLVWV